MIRVFGDTPFGAEDHGFKSRFEQPWTGLPCQRRSKLTPSPEQGSESRGMGSAFHMLLERCSWPLTPTAPTSTRLHVTYMLTLKAPIMTAAEDIYKYFFIVFQRK